MEFEQFEENVLGALRLDTRMMPHIECNWCRTWIFLHWSISTFPVRSIVADRTEDVNIRVLSDSDDKLLPRVSPAALLGHWTSIFFAR
jgi:hypothetical protein